MQFVFLTPGTGSFYCGSCVRDHALTTQLRTMGHEVLHLPLYLPHKVDGEDDSLDRPIFYGGINVYLQEKLALFRRTPKWLDRLFDSRWLLARVASRSGSTSPHELGALTHSMLKGESGHQQKEMRKLIDWLHAEGIKPDVIALSNILLIGMAKSLKAAFDCRVVCSLQGEESFLQDLPERWREQCWSALREDLQHVDGFLTPSRWFGDVMRGHLGDGLDPLHVLPNGIPATSTKRRDKDEKAPVVIGYLARLCELKGQPRMVEAFIELSQRPGLPPVELHLAGTVTGRDPELVEQLKQEIANAGLTDRVRWGINLDGREKAAFLESIDLLSVPALYGEAFGLYQIEAWAAGVPTIQPRHAAFPELLEISGAGWLFDADTPGDYAKVLEEAVRDVEERQLRAEKGREAVATHFSIGRMAARFVELAREEAPIPSADSRSA